jgi:hypothetical protein
MQIPARLIVGLSTPGKFYKRRSQEKHASGGWIFSWFAAHVFEQDLF